MAWKWSGDLLTNRERRERLLNMLKQSAKQASRDEVEVKSEVVVKVAHYYSRHNNSNKSDLKNVGCELLAVLCVVYQRIEMTRK